MAPPRGRCSSSEKLESWFGSKSSSAAMDSISLLTAPPFPRFWGRTRTLIGLHKARVTLSLWEHSSESQGQGQFAEAMDPSSVAQALCTQHSTWYSVLSTLSSGYHSGHLGLYLKRNCALVTYSETEGKLGYGDGTGRHTMALCQQRKALGPPRGALLRDRSQASSLGVPGFPIR